jgi:hypothetical protein
MTTVIKGGPGGSLNRDITSIDDGDSPYTTSGEDILLVDTSSGTVTVTLSTADVTADPENRITIIDSGNNAGTNAITINTEGSANINPGGASSVSIDGDGQSRTLQADGTDWFDVQFPISDGTGIWNRTDIGTDTHTLTAWESAWINTTDASASFVDVTLPADADVSDADRVEVGVEDATNETRINANTGQSIIGQTANITTEGARTYEFKSTDSAWMVR